MIPRHAPAARGGWSWHEFGLLCFWTIVGALIVLAIA